MSEEETTSKPKRKRVPKPKKVPAGKVLVSHTAPTPLRFRFLDGVVEIAPGKEVEFDAHAWEVFTSARGRGRSLCLMIARGEILVRR